MANTSGNSNWERIQNGVSETERLIGQRDYNSAMIKARQTLEFMVKQLADRAAMITDGDLKELIDALYQNRWISKTTCEHYHKIRIIGNKAAHEGDSNAYNANQAYHMLSQEVYTFANDYSNAKKGSRSRQASRGRAASGAASGSSSGAASSKRSGAGERSSVQSSRGSASTRSRRQASRKPAFTPYDLLKLLIPILCIVLLFFIVRLFGPGKDTAETTAPTTATETVAETPEDTAGSPESEAPAAVTYRTTTTLNVRPEPSTDSERLGQLAEGTEVDYVRAHDEEWAVIMYNGQEAYVASQYLTGE